MADTRKCPSTPIQDRGHTSAGYPWIRLLSDDQGHGRVIDHCGAGGTIIIAASARRNGQPGFRRGQRVLCGWGRALHRRHYRRTTRASTSGRLRCCEGPAGRNGSALCDRLEASDLADIYVDP